MSEAPAPSRAGITKPPPNIAEQYTMLQRKMDNLEKIHKDGKKANQAEVERFKLELARLQKTNSELTDSHDKHKKQKETLSLRVDELKKNATSDKAEIKDLSVKLRMSEHQRSQMTAKHEDIADMKKAMQSLELRRKDEMKERDRTIGDLEKSLAAEKKKREMTESQLKDMKTKVESETGLMKEAVDKWKADSITVRDELQKTKQCLLATQRDAESREKTLLKQLQEHREMLKNVAEHYSILASSTVPKTAHKRLEYENMAVHLSLARASRKLGNSEAQVSELVHLIRHSMEQNQLLQISMKHMEEELSSYIDYAVSRPPFPPSYTSLDETIAHLDHDQQEFETEVARATVESLRVESELYRLQYNQVLSAYTEADAELQEATVVVSKLEEVTQQRNISQELLQATTTTAESLRSSLETFKQQVAELESRLRMETYQADEALKKEKDTVNRLTTAVQKSRMAENGLRAEIEQLTTELTDAERFQEAYYSLSGELDKLLARNALAEDEAQRLSHVNAEILGHQNPMQRIVYVEKIRNELADTKQKLLISARASESVSAQNRALLNELEMYKSVAVPVSLKPRTKLTRVARPPLVNLTKSTLNIHGNEEVEKSAEVYLESIVGDMTLDEIL